ncbi:MAG: 50S ribosomal protein L9 [Candidatus Beckwithbacteria bacterium]|nr:50S ribosomal protein L9 [Candidatus Beckwithbacteria bacterium]
MKVIILKTGEVKEVALGYAVNYLLPKKLAVIATKQKLEEIKKKTEELKSAKNQEETADQQTMKKLEGKVIEIKTQAGKNGKIHGSITKKEIAKELKILKTNIILEEPIKKVGEYEIELKFGKAKGKIKLKLSAK